LDSHFSVFKDEAGFRTHSESGGSGQKRLGVGFALLVLSGADQGFELVEEIEGGEGLDNTFAGASGHYGEGDFAELHFDLFEDFGDSLELRQNLVIKLLFSPGDGFDGHGKPMQLVESGDDLNHGQPSPGVEGACREFAVPFGKRLGPGNLMKRHGVDDGAVAVEEVGLKGARGDFQLHLSIVALSSTANTSGRVCALTITQLA
jgi:hypothetical protein